MVKSDWWMNQPAPNSKEVPKPKDRPARFKDHAEYRRWWRTTEAGRESNRRSQQKHQEKARAMFPGMPINEARTLYAEQRRETKGEHPAIKNLWWNKPGAVNPLKGKKRKNEEDYAPKQTYENYYKDYYSTPAGKAAKRRSRDKYIAKAQAAFPDMGKNRAIYLYARQKRHDKLNKQYKLGGEG